MSLKYINTISADSKPVLDKWGMDDHWDLDDWVRWHQMLVYKYPYKNKYGNLDADLIWLTAWNKQDGDTQPKNQLALPTANKAATDYIRKDGYLYIGSKAFLSDIYPNPFEQALKAGEFAVEGVKVIAESVMTGLKILKWTVIIAGVGIVVVGGAVAWNALGGGKSTQYIPLPKK